MNNTSVAHAKHNLTIVDINMRILLLEVGLCSNLRSRVGPDIDIGMPMLQSAAGAGQ